jgi:phosphonate transport system substrate-binding protein
MPRLNRSLKVFLCHAHADRDPVRRLYARLKNDGVDAWLDKEKLLPGQDWELEIRKAVRDADIVVVCLSKQFNQAGFRQKEVRLALDTAMEKPEGEIFIIPARLEECDNLESLRKWHWVDLFQEDGYEMLMRALQARSNKIGATLQIKKIWLPNIASSRRSEATIEKKPELKQESSKAGSLKPKKIETKNKKANTAIIIAMIGLVGTVVAIVITSALIGKIFSSRPEPTGMKDTTEPTETARAIGSLEHPIKILFIPSVDANIILNGGEIMAASLNKATSLNFEVVIPTSYAATVEEMCASPADTMAFLTGLGYAIANQMCGVDVAFKAIRFGYPVFWTEYIVARNSDIQSLADLEGKKWGYSDQASTNGYMIPTVELAEAGVTPGEQVQTSGHNQTVIAVYNGEVDFGTVFYSVPLNPEGATIFTYDDFLAGSITDLAQYEIPDEAIANCAPDTEGKKMLCDGYQIMDARANIRIDYPDVIQKVRILAISQAVPNDTFSFGPEFPVDLRAQIEEAFVAFSQTEDWNITIGSTDFYGWSGASPADDAEYDFVRAMVEATGYKLSK